MSILVNPPPIYFMHLQKTGGTALGQWLRSAYFRDSYIDLRAENLYRIPLSSLPGFRCFHSWHLGRRMYDLIDRNDLSVITMLRDPIERAVSSIQHHQRAALRSPKRFTPEALAMMESWLNADINACIMAGFADIPMQDAQVRTLGSYHSYSHLFRCLSRETAFADMFASYPILDYPWLDLRRHTDDTASLQRAHTWLDQMAVVGLTERYTESLELIADLIGIPVPANPPLANVNPERSHPTMRYRDRLQPAAMAHLEALNRHDSELYAHATALFEEQWARYKARPRRTYSIAAHVHIPVYRVRSALKNWIFSRYPRLAQHVVVLRRCSRSMNRS